MPTATPIMLLCWLASALSAAVYFYPHVLLAERTDLSLFVRTIHLTTAMAMASLAATTLAPSRVDVAMACAGETPEALRMLVTYGVVYAAGLACLALESVLTRGPASRALCLRLAQIALVSLFGQVVAHRGDLLCTDAERRQLTSLGNRAAFFGVYAWCALAFTICDKIEASLAPSEGESDDEASGDEEAGDIFAEAGEYVQGALDKVEGELRLSGKGDKKY